MKKCSNPTIEERLSWVNTKLGDAMELMQNSCASICQACAIIPALESEIEEVYVAIGEDNSDIQTKTGNSDSEATA